MNLVLIANVSLLGATLASVLVMIDHMDKGTRGSVRWGAVLLLVGIAAEVIGYFYHWSGWTDTLFFGGAAMSVAANLRFSARDLDMLNATARELARRRARRQADRYAYSILGVTLLGLLAAWAKG